MRYAVLSDIHGNLEALTATLEAIAALDVDGYLCLGDVVGYGANPNESIDILRSLDAPCVCGNHDAAVFDPPQRTFFNPLAKRAVEWTDDVVNESNRKYLIDLPLSEHMDDILLVHASPSDPGAWCYVTDVVSASFEFNAFTERACLIGHSHVPMVVSQRENGISRVRADEVALLAGTRFIINVGSTGQPRDGDPRAAFGVIDTDAETVKLHRVQYDVETARRKIIDSGLPEFLGDRLLAGQ